MSKTNREHSPAFKAQVALAAVKGDQTISQVAAHYRLHVNLVAHWKKQLRDNAATVFTPTGKPPHPTMPASPNSTNTSGGSRWSSPSWEKSPG